MRLQELARKEATNTLWQHKGKYIDHRAFEDATMNDYAQVLINFMSHRYLRGGEGEDEMERKFG